MRIRIVASAAVIGLLGVALPVRLPGPSSGPASAVCVTLTDTPPDPNRADLLAVLERCSALNPGDVELMADLGAQYELTGRLSSAETVYRRALSVDPGYADLRLRLGRLFLRRGDVSAARREAQMALKVQPNRQALLDLLRDTTVSLAQSAE